MAETASANAESMLGAGGAAVNSAELQYSITELAKYPSIPEAEWVARVNAASTEVIAGAILNWHGGGGVSNVPDPLASRREAAQAILQARLSNQMTTAAKLLRETINDYQRKSARQTTWMLWLTCAIVGLTVVMVVGVAVQIWMGWPAEVA